MGVFDKLLMTDEEKEQAEQLNNIGYINSLNTHNWEMQQKLQMLMAENAQRQSQEQLGLFFVKIGDRGYYVCEAVWQEIETLRKALKPFADAVKDECNWKYDINVDDFHAAAAAIRDKK